MFRLFLTHVATQKEAAHSLKSQLHFYGADAFVAMMTFKRERSGRSSSSQLFTRVMP